MTTDNKVYILQKQLPNLGVGAKFQSDGKGEYHCYSQYIGESEGYSIAHFPAKDVENNPEWFKLKEEDKRIVVSHFREHDNYLGNKSDTFFYQFCTTKKIPQEKYEAVRKGIEFTLNDTTPAESIPTLERQDEMPVSAMKSFGEITHYSIEKLPIAEQPKPKQMYAKHCGIHNYNDICKGMGCEEYNPLNPEHK